VPRVDSPSQARNGSDALKKKRWCKARTEEISAAVLARGGVRCLRTTLPKRSFCCASAQKRRKHSGFHHRFFLFEFMRSSASGNVYRVGQSKRTLARSLHRILFAQFELQRRLQRDFCVFFSQPRCYFRENQEQSLKRGGRLCGGLDFWLQSFMRTAHRCSLFIRSFTNLSEFHKKCLRVR
jgi:hypothetical protein